ncbi:unnamed protein product [Camellia sinensis]
MTFRSLSNLACLLMYVGSGAWCIICNIGFVSLSGGSFLVGASLVKCDIKEPSSITAKSSFSFAPVQLWFW